MDDTHFGFVLRDGVQLHYATRGRGPLILCLHGFPDFWRVWQPFLAAFSESYTVVAPDMRGYNLSSKPEGLDAYRVEEIAQDIDALASHFTDNPFVLVGHDWGGVSAWNFAIERPERLSRLVVLNAPHPAVFQNAIWHDPHQRAASQYISRLRQKNSEESLFGEGEAGMWARFYEPRRKAGKLSDDDKRAYLAAWSQPGAGRAMVNWYRAAPFDVPVIGGAPATPSWLKGKEFQVSVPTLVCWGEQDGVLMPSLLDTLPAYVCDLTVKRFSNAGHNPHQDAQAATFAEIRAFIERSSCQ